MLNKADERVEKGKLFGKKKSKDFDNIYHKSNQILLKLIVDKINKEKVVISDYGGGNGIVSKEIKKLLIKKGIKEFKIEVIDIDNKKFVKDIRFNNIKEDITSFSKKAFYDYSIARLVLHYLSITQQRKFIKKAYENLKQGGYFLVINWFTDNPKEYKIRNNLFAFVSKEKGISRRTIPKSKILLNICKKQGFKLVSKRKFIYRLSINDFFRNRYGLSEKSIDYIINKLKIKGYADPIIGYLFKR